MSAIDTQGMTVTKGKYGIQLGKKFTSIRYNNGTSYFSCLGTLPIGGFSLMLGSFKRKRYNLCILEISYLHVHSMQYNYNSAPMDLFCFLL